jgi:hypothetical protein
LQRAANIVEEALRSSKTLSTYCGAAGQKG